MRPPLVAEVRGFIFSLDYYIEGFDLPPFVFVKQLVLFQKLKVLTYGGKTDDHTVIALFSNLKYRGHGSREDPQGREESLGRMEHSCSHNLQSLTPIDPCRLLTQQKTHIRQALRLPHMVRLPSRRLVSKLHHRPNLRHSRRRRR